MAILAHKCPHCLTEHIALNVVAASSMMGGHECTVHLTCPRCGLPSCAHLQPNQPNPVDPNQLQGQQGDITQYRWKVASFWPVAPGPLIPEHLPPEVERVYLQAE